MRPTEKVGNRNVGIGTAAPGNQRLYVKHNLASENMVNFENTNTTTPQGIGINFSGAAPNNATQTFIAAGDNVANRFLVYSNGNVVNTNNSYGALSDRRLKEHIRDARPFLADLMKLRVREYSYRESKSSRPNDVGVVSQEVEEVFPGIVGVNAEGYKMVTCSKFVPMLIKAVQEQQAEIEALRTEIKELRKR